MKIFLSTAALVMTLTFAAGAVAQESNDQVRHDAAVQTAQAHKADKAQTKADKAEYKADTSHKAKKAAHKQDQANREEQKAGQPPR